MIELDGSRGEGGGQILRTSLTLSALTGKPFRLANVRANRPKPGLQAQHLAAVRAAAAVCGARTEGAQLGSRQLVFEPQAVTAGNYHFPIGTAGATGLVLHTALLPLALTPVGSESSVILEGGTHVRTSPAYPFNEVTWGGYLRRLGCRFEHALERPGFFPRGGGRVRVSVHGVGALEGTERAGLDLVSARPPVGRVTVTGVVRGLPESIARRMAERAAQRLRARRKLEVETDTDEGPGGPGAALVLRLESTPVPTVVMGFGERGVASEAVADAAADEALAFLDSTAGVDPHSGDQLVLPLALAAGPSRFRVTEVTRHLTTNIETVRFFLDRVITLTGEEGAAGLVEVA